MRAISIWISRFLNSPLKVLTWCCLLSAGSLLFSGNLIRLYRLNRDSTMLNEQILRTKKEISQLDHQMMEAKDPDFIERQAMNLYDFAEEDDLVFVFSE